MQYNVWVGMVILMIVSMKCKGEETMKEYHSNVRHVSIDPTGRFLRDAKLYEIGAGTSEIRRLVIARLVFLALI